MFLIALTWVITVVAAFFLGYFLRGLTKKIAQLEQAIAQKVDKKPEEPEPEPVSELIDPTDPIANAKWEHDQLMKKLNPDG